MTWRTSFKDGCVKDTRVSPSPPRFLDPAHARNRRRATRHAVESSLARGQQTTRPSSILHACRAFLPFVPSSLLQVDVSAEVLKGSREYNDAMSRMLEVRKATAFVKTHLSELNFVRATTIDRRFDLLSLPSPAFPDPHRRSNCPLLTMKKRDMNSES